MLFTNRTYTKHQDIRDQESGVFKTRNGEIAKWRNGEIAKWRNDEMAKWRNGEMELKTRATVIKYELPSEIGSCFHLLPNLFCG